ncbi:MAG: hypothetical protein ACXWTU_00430 [Methylotenera sp.]
MNIANLRLGNQIKVRTDYNRGIVVKGMIIDIEDDEVVYETEDDGLRWAYSSAVIEIIG